MASRLSIYSTMSMVFLRCLVCVHCCTSGTVVVSGKDNMPKMDKSVFIWVLKGGCFKVGKYKLCSVKIKHGSDPQVMVLLFNLRVSDEVCMVSLFL